MTAATSDNEGIHLNLSKQEALILFEWLSRNWEKSKWGNDDLFLDPAEKQILVWIENDLSSVLGNVFDQNYQDELVNAYKNIVDGGF
jgi:hypothetical protein